MLRCIGLGECRKHDSGSMCPSYMVTLEEQHSTRGRAHMLFELLQGEVVAGGWKDEHVKASLDLCLSCKACKTECPANVDMATYRAEFLSHYYEGRRRPLYAYAFGMVDRWLELASVAPGIANAAMNAPGLSHLVRRALHLAPQPLALGEASHHLQRIAENHTVRPVLVVLIELGLIHALRDAVKVGKEICRRLPGFVFTLVSFAQQIVYQGLGLDLLLDVERRSVNDQI